MNSEYFLRKLNLTLQIDNTLVEEMNLLSKNHFPNEFGGLLIGYYRDNNKVLVITDILTPTTFRASPILFERETSDLLVSLQNYYNAMPSKFYVGEWHSHPNGHPFPSKQDVNAMMQISSSENVSIKKPILCIVGCIKTECIVQFHLILKNKIHTYEKT